MSSATKEILGRVRQLVPPMLDKFHKGESTCYTAPSGNIRDRVVDNGPGTRDGTQD